MQDIERYKKAKAESWAMILTLLGQVGQPGQPDGVRKVLWHDFIVAHDDYIRYSDRLGAAKWMVK